MGDSYDAVLKCPGRLGDLPCRARRISALDRTVIKRAFFVLPICRDLFAALGLSSFPEQRRSDRMTEPTPSQVPRRYSDPSTMIVPRFVVEIASWFSAAICRSRSIVVTRSFPDCGGTTSIRFGRGRGYRRAPFYIRLAAQVLVVVLFEAALADDSPGRKPLSLNSSSSSCRGLISPTYPMTWASVVPSG